MPTTPNAALASNAVCHSRDPVKLFATYCSANKEANPEDLPAAKRYISDRIDGVHSLANGAQARFAILSGRFGLLTADEPIPPYDHLLQRDEVEAMTERVAATLEEWGITEVDWFSVAFEMDPNVTRYRDVMKRAAERVGARLELVIWEPTGTLGLV